MDIESIIPEIAMIVERRVGIKPQAVGDSTWLRAVRKRMEALDICKADDYFRKVTSNAAEFHQLVELIVVPETWFVRERSAIDFMVAFIKNQEDIGRRIPWRILSMACATGEEAYSIAMVLYDAGVPLSRFTIEGVDISKVALDVAKKASYGSNSFRNKATLMHRGNFEKVEDRYVVRQDIRNRVKFTFENVARSQFYFNRRKYDIIFCRNLLIYFSSEVQSQLLTFCEQILDENGALFFGPAESEVARLAGFVPIGPRNACAFQRRPLGKATPKVLKPKMVQSSAAIVEEPSIKLEHHNIAPQKELLKQAIEYANEGHLKRAYELCQQYLKNYEPNTEIYFLLGAIHVASKEDEKADHYFQKAVYLSPDHYDALVNLALISERRGDNEQAQLFWKRARKQHDKLNSDE
jgi:chemotaxis protein methyltransferase WspC